VQFPKHRLDVVELKKLINFSHLSCCHFAYVLLVLLKMSHHSFYYCTIEYNIITVETNRLQTDVHDYLKNHCFMPFIVINVIRVKKRVCSFWPTRYMLLHVAVFVDRLSRNKTE